MEIKDQLEWWTNTQALIVGVPLSTFKPDLSIFTDASTEEWGAHLENQEISGTWNKQEKTLHINILELRAVRLAIDHFSVQLAEKQLLVTVIAYINHQGGTRLRSLMEETNQLFLLAQEKKISTHSRSTKCTSRQTDWEKTNSANRMVTPPSSTREALATMGQTHDRPVCNKRKQQAIIIREPSSEQICLCSRCPDDPVEQPICVCLSTNRTDNQRGRQTKIIKLQHDFDSTLVARETLVPRPSPSTNINPSSTSSQVRPSETTSHTGVPSKSKISTTARMEAIQQAVINKGFSEKIAKQITGAINPGSKSI